jgi:hypothetical protein
MSTQALALLGKALKLTDDTVDKGKRTNRVTELLKAPDDEQSTGWFMCVPSCFNNALDIRQTPRKKDGKDSLIWTQGSAFSFKPGDAIYDTSKAYSEWGEALKHLSVCIQVNQATNAAPEKSNADGDSTVPRNPGVVRFSILTPNDQRTAVVKSGDAELTQDEFVRFLIGGPDGELKRRFAWKR